MMNSMSGGIITDIYIKYKKKKPYTVHAFEELHLSYHYEFQFVFEAFVIEISQHMMYKTPHK